MGLGNTNFGFSAGGGSTPPPSTTSWMLNGNTVGSEKYFGTNDNFSIPLYTNGKAVGILTKDGDFAIGSTAPLTRITSVSNDYKAILSSIRFGNQASAPSGLVGLRARGTDLSPLPIIQGDEISSFSGIGYHDGGSFGSTGDGNAIFYAAENFKPTNRGTSFKIGTTPIGTTTVVYNFGVDSEGNTSMGITSLNPSARLHVKGIDATSSNYALKVDNSASSPLLYVRNDGNVGIGTTTPTGKLHVYNSGALVCEIESTVNAPCLLDFKNDGSDYNLRLGSLNSSSAVLEAVSRSLDVKSTNEINLGISSNVVLNINNNQNVGIGTSSPAAKLHIQGIDATSSNYALKVDNSASSPLLYVRNDSACSIGIANALARLHIFGMTDSINQRIEPLSNVTQDTSGGTIVTTDASVNVTAQSISIPVNRVMSLESTIVYKKTAGAGVGSVGDGTTIILNSSVKNVGGTLTLDTVQNTYTGTTNAIVGAVATYTISGTNVLVSVTGVLKDNITWNVITKVNTVA